MSKNAGALWKRVSSKTGLDYLSGEIRINNMIHKISAFVNDRKDNEKQPDYNILLNEEKEK